MDKKDLLEKLNKLVDGIDNSSYNIQQLSRSTDEAHSELQELYSRMEDLVGEVQEWIDEDTDKEDEEDKEDKEDKVE